MIRRFALLILLLPVIALAGCSSANSGAPAGRTAHPAEWIITHPQHALATADFADCTVCHGKDLQGSGDVVSCYSCHSFNTAPPFIIHPAGWGDNVYVNHRSYANSHGFSSCSKCHGPNLHGSPAAPSCYSTSFKGQGCHAQGPAVAPHPVDGSFLDPKNHGPAAKGLTAAFPDGIADCQQCHGQPGGPGSNPRFNRGIIREGDKGCEGCHGPYLAHPANWAGPNATFHYSVSKKIIQKACTLCHGVKLNGLNADGTKSVGVSCLNCHAETTNFTLDCTKCHGYPPDGSADHATAEVSNGMGVDHRIAGGTVADVSAHDSCVVCHGMKESATGGGFAATPGYKLFDKATNTLGDHWNGKIDMNRSPKYDQGSLGCNSACHANDADHELPNASGLPVELQDFGYGGAVPHPVDGSFLDPSNHGAAAKGLTAAFPDGMLDCQSCHAQSGVNPRFNVGIGGNGCETCHNDNTSHPSVGARENVHWYDGPYTHSDVPVAKFTTICTLCHGAHLGGAADGGVATAPACTDCHVVSPVQYPTGCVSCHNVPPDGNAPAGNVRPNRQGQHNLLGHSSDINADPSQTCSRCHKGAGIGTAAHFDDSPPADVNFEHPDALDTITAVSTATNTTCTGVCHIINGSTDIVHQHTNETWY